MTPAVGNDVVDLAWVRDHGDSEARRARLQRRILTPQDARQLAEAEGAHEAELLTWAFWAAKEAAFKVHTKRVGSPPTFHHRNYTAHFDLSLLRDEGAGLSPTLRSLAGVVEGPGFILPITGWVTERFLHLAGYLTDNKEEAVGGGAYHLDTGVECLTEPDVGLGERIEGEFTDREWACIHSALSARVRLLARSRILSYLRSTGLSGETPPRVEILTDPGALGRRPPTVWLDGAHFPALELSLSHHGSCAAWALLFPQKGD